MKGRLLKILLAVLLIITIIPRSVFAEDSNGSSTNTDDPIAETGNNGSDNEPADTGDGKDPDKDDEGQVDGPVNPAPGETPAADPENKEDEEKKEEPRGEKSEVVADLLLSKNEGEGEKEEEEQSLYKRTILMYLCGSDLESGSGLATHNLEQILNSHFSDGDKVKYIIMTGGSDENNGWYLDSSYLYDPKTGSQINKISDEYNCIWEAKGLDAAENPGKLVLLDGDGIMGDGENARRAKPIVDEEGEKVKGNYEFMSDPNVLREFINYGVNNFPAEKYDLILWNHGGGPLTGYAMDEHSHEMMPFVDIIDVFSNNNLINAGKKFDIINFDACLMNSIELLLCFAPYTDYYIASAEQVPGDGEYYSDWLDLLGQNPDINSFALGKKIVDDFYTYYEDGIESLDATMALVDTAAFMNSGIVDDLLTLNNILSRQLDNILFYDELAAHFNSLHYGKQKYYVDFGNLISQICVAVKEFDETYVPVEGRDLEVNDYYDVAMHILNILANKDIFYSRCTSVVHTEGDFMYRKTDGNISFSDLRPLESSGTYIYFVPVSNNQEAREYYYQISAVIQKLPDGNIKTLFTGYLNTMSRTEMLIRTGVTVSKMLNEYDKYKKEDFDYQYVKDYWMIDPPEYEEMGWDFSEWGTSVGYIVNRVLGRAPDCDDPEPKEFVDWMDKMIKQMAAETIVKKNISLYETKRVDNKTGYQVRFTDTRKRVIDKVSYNLVAELPILDKYIEDENLGWLFRGDQHSNMELSIGMVAGAEDFDMDIDESTEESFIEDYIRWLNGSTATWNLDPLEKKWYALKDAEGKLHAVTMEMYHGYYLVPTGIAVSDELDEAGYPDLQLVALFFEPNEESNTYDLASFMICEDGAYRPVEAKDLKRTLVLTPCMALPMMVSDLYAPISPSFTITADKDKNNTDQIKLVYTDIDNIPDIKDTTGDGNKLTSQIVVTDIYGTKINLTDMIDNPAGQIIDINLCQVFNDEYDGKKHTPRIVYNGVTLKEGIDYNITTIQPEPYFDEIGEYRIFLDGKGNYTGNGWFDYKILPGYTNKKGANAVWYKGSGNGCEFTYERSKDPEMTYRHFADYAKRAVEIDGKAIPESGYEYASGSLIIRLKPEYLNSLSVGNHAIVVVFDDNESKPIRFTIRDKEEEKKHEPAHYIFPITGIERINISR